MPNKISFISMHIYIYIYNYNCLHTESFICVKTTNFVCGCLVQQINKKIRTVTLYNNLHMHGHMKNTFSLNIIALSSINSVKGDDGSTFKL